MSLISELLLIAVAVIVAADKITMRAIWDQDIYHWRKLFFVTALSDMAGISEVQLFWSVV